MKRLNIFISALSIVLLLSGCNSSGSKEKNLIIFHAGSLSAPLRKIATIYEEQNPGVKVLLESAGSVVTARKITELKRPCDIMASADYFVIDNMLIPDYAGWNIHFATNEMVLCYQENSAYLNEITADNWQEILLRDDVIYSRADPNDDPCGYRTIFSFMLTEKQKGLPGLTDKLLLKNANYVRPKGIDLVAMIETKNVDYIFEYKSIAVQQGLKFIELNKSVNLSDPGFRDIYSSVSVNIKGSEPGQEIAVTGDYILYGATILKDAVNRADAEGFLRLLLSDAGREIFASDGQNPIIPPLKSGPEELPSSLAEFLSGQEIPIPIK